MKTNRTLVADPKLLLDIIKRQAGSLEKAVLEGVMNAREAGSSRVIIELDPVCESIEAYKPGVLLTLSDTGQGFRNKTEIAEWFNKFGKPHTKDEKKTWAQFRMGRGQMFAFGRNVWRSGEFRMELDVNRCGLDWHLEDGLPLYTGCRIDIHLYENPINTGSYPSIETFKAAIKKQIEFMDGEIEFNKDQLNTPASHLDWDAEDDDAYYMFGKGQDLAFYNLGAFVRTWSASRAGVTGVVVSKRQLKVNFARNDIQHDCEVFRRIQEVVKENRIKKIRKQRRDLNRDERCAMLCDLRDGSVDYSECRALGLIRLSNDKVMSLDAVRKIRSPWCFAKHGDMRADRLLWSEDAVCFDNDLLHELNYSGEECDFFDWLMRITFRNDCRHSGNMKSQWAPMKGLHRPFHKLTAGISNTRRRLPQDKWTKAERRIVRVLEGFQCWGGRAICIGLSDTALAWTDGSSYICLGREYLKKASPNQLWGASHLTMVMFHELAHRDSTEESHHHGMEFYQNFHDLVCGDLRGGWNYVSPTFIMAQMAHKLRMVKAEDYQEAVVKKEQKAKAARDKKLGLGKVAALESKPPVTVTRVKRPVKLKVQALVVKGKLRRRRRS